MTVLWFFDGVSLWYFEKRFRCYKIDNGLNLVRRSVTACSTAPRLRSSVSRCRNTFNNCHCQHHHHQHQHHQQHQHQQKLSDQLWNPPIALSDEQLTEGVLSYGHLSLSKVAEDAPEKIQNKTVLILLYGKKWESFLTEKESESLRGWKGKCSKKVEQKSKPDSWGISLARGEVFSGNWEITHFIHQKDSVLIWSPSLFNFAFSVMTQNLESLW